MKLYKFNIALLSAIILTVTAVNLLMPKTETISYAENRKLAEKPAFSSEKLFSGKYFKEYDAYFSDHFLMRDRFVTVAKEIQSYAGMQSSDVGRIIMTHGENVVSTQSGSGSSKANQPNPTNIFFLEDRAMTIFKFNQHNADLYVKSYNDLVSKIPTDVKVTTFLAPDSIEFSTFKQTKGIADSQREALDYYKSRLDPRTIFIDAIPAIDAHKEEYIYFRTDHHWTQRGAYYGYTAFAKAHGFEPIPLDEFKASKGEGFLGSRYKLNNALEPYPDYIEYFEHPNLPEFKTQISKNNALKETTMIIPYFLKTDAKYATFMGGDHPLALIDSPNKNGQVLLMLKDSFGNPLIPFLAQHYEKIVVIDPRHLQFDLIDTIEQYGVTEVLFLNTIHSASKTLNQQLDALTTK